MGAITSLGPLLAGRPSRPIDIGRERIFITNPYSLATAELASREEPARAGRKPAGPEEPAGREQPSRCGDPGRAARLADPAIPARPGWPG